MQGKGLRRARGCLGQVEAARVTDRTVIINTQWSLNKQQNICLTRTTAPAQKTAVLVFLRSCQNVGTVGWFLAIMLLAKEDDSLRNWKNERLEVS